MGLKIDAEFKALIPPLTDEEYQLLEKSIIADGCRDPLSIWGDTIIDGHNRYEICERNKIDVEFCEYEFDSRDEAMIWIIDNQFGRRNLPTITRGLLVIRRQEICDRRELAKENEVRSGKMYGKGHPKGFPNWENPIESVNITEDIAKEIGSGKNTASRIVKIDKKATPEQIKDIETGKASINSVYKEIKREENKAKVAAISKNKPAPPKGKYSVIVMDPPWPMQKIDRDCAPNQTGLDYPTMSEDELSELEVPAADDCHLWLWTTHKYMPMGLRLLSRWGFKYVCQFVWHKNGGFQPFNLPQYNCEFALYARKGAPKFADTKAFNVCFDAPRGKHSEKPEEFYNVVRRVTDGTRIDIFNRRAIDGFDVWGNEA